MRVFRNADLAQNPPYAVAVSVPYSPRASNPPPSGDKTGKTDGAAINSALSTNLSAQLACNSQYYTDVTIQVPGGASFVGCGYSSKLLAVGTIAGGIVQLSMASTDQNAAQLVGNFQITGGTATEALLAGGEVSVGPVGGVHLFNIEITGGTYTNAVWFSYFFNNQVDNIIIDQALGQSLIVSAACFHFDGAVNADVFSNLSADCGAPYGFYMQNDQGQGGGSTGNTFNTLNVEGGCNGGGTAATCAGLYVGGQFGASTFNGVYTENVLHPIVLGNASTNEQCSTLTFNSPTLIGPASAANQVALVDIENCYSVTFNAPDFSIYPIGGSAPLTFSGGGCSTEPTGTAIPNPSGVVKVVTLIFPGAGCTSAPTVTVGGTGTGASVAATETGGVVTGLTLNSGGSGYTLQGIVPIIYNRVARPVTFNDPFCNDRSGNGTPCWAYVVAAAGASGGIEINGDAFVNPVNGDTVPAHLQYTGVGNRHYMSYLDSSGATHTLNVVPQAYP